MISKEMNIMFTAIVIIMSVVVLFVSMLVMSISIDATTDKVNWIQFFVLNSCFNGMIVFTTLLVIKHVTLSGLM